MRKNWKEFVNEVACDLGVTTLQCNKLIGEVTATMAKMLRKGDIVRVRTVGTFYVARRQRRRQYNINTETVVTFPVKNVIRFRKSKITRFFLGDISQTPRQVVQVVADGKEFGVIKSYDVIEAVFTRIYYYVQMNITVNLRNFGTFKLIYKQPRMVRNPRTGVPMSIPGNFMISFVPSLKLKQSVN